MTKEWNLIRVNAGVKKESITGTEVVVEYVKSITKKGLLRTKALDQKEQITIFFPEISISNRNDIKTMCSFDDWYHYNNFMGPKANMHEEFLEIVGLMWYNSPDYTTEDENFDYPRFPSTGYGGFALPYGGVVVEGKGNDGQAYYALVHSEDLYRRVKEEQEDRARRWLHKQYEEAKPRLERLERAGRYEEAAKIYEEFNMLDKARETRLKGRTVVSVDLNRLLQQLGERGFTITYSCSRCGAPLKISGGISPEAMKFCSHCGSRIEPVDLARFIKSHLS